MRKPRAPALFTHIGHGVLDHLARQREGWLVYLDSEPDFEVMIERREGGTAPAWVVVLQAIQHGNDHRTHAGTVLLGHQLEAPDIDDLQNHGCQSIQRQQRFATVMLGAPVPEATSHPSSS